MNYTQQEKKVKASWRTLCLRGSPNDVGGDGWAVPVPRLLPQALAHLHQLVQPKGPLWMVHKPGHQHPVDGLAPAAAPSQQAASQALPPASGAFCCSHTGAGTWPGRQNLQVIFGDMMGGSPSPS